jgi:hypothetical protein
MIKILIIIEYRAMEEQMINVELIEENFEENDFEENDFEEEELVITPVKKNKGEKINMPEIDLTKLSKDELKGKCKELGIKGYSSKNKQELIGLIQHKLGQVTEHDSNISTTNCKLVTKHSKEDKYTKDILKQFYNVHKSYVEQIKELSKKIDIKVRLPSIPEYISENIIKFIIHKNGDESSNWNCSGDLYSQIEGKQECKCFTSPGPISFTPSSEWDIIYFLDAREWLNDNFIVYRVNLTKQSDEWKHIPMNKKQSFDDQCKQGRRPRIGWDSLHKYIEDHCEKIYEGTFNEIIN